MANNSRSPKKKKNLFGKATKTDPPDKKAPIVDSLPQKNHDRISDNREKYGGR